MIENIKNFPVNWIEGMKINKNHFIELQAYVEDNLRDSRNIIANEFHYGLLSPSNLSPFQYSITIDTHNELSVDIKSLKAITPGGGRIEISEYTNLFHEKIVLKDLDNNYNYFVMLNIDPFQRIPLGEQNMNEIPPRFPHTTSHYFITILSDSDLTYNKIGSLQLPIAKFKVTANKFEISSTYVPPCLYVNSHSSLVNLFEKQDAFFKNLEFQCVQIIQKIKFRNSTDGENTIATMVFQSCERILQQVERIITQNKWKKHVQSPYEVLENIVSFSRSIKNGFDCFSGDGKETLFNYFSEWTDAKSGEYEKLFSNTININFKSFDIEETIYQTSHFLNTIEKLYGILNQLDYIGRKRDSGIFVNENVLKTDKVDSSIFKNDEPEEKDKKNNNSTHSFLAD